MNAFGVNYVHQSFGDYTLALTGELKQLVPLHVSCIVSGEETPGLSESATEVFRCRRFRHPLSAWSANKIVQSLGFSDVIHWQAAGNPWVDAAALRVVNRQPFVVTVHDVVAHPGDRSVLPGTFSAIRRLVNKADQVIVHAESVKRQVVGVGVDPSVVHVVPHGELGTVFRQGRGRQAAGRRTERNTILFFGRMHEYKGLDVLLEAMDEVVVKRPQTALVIAGKGPSVDRLGRDLQRRPWLTIRPGYVSSADVASLFDQAAVVVLPYIEASQSGVAALAVGMGRATVASAVGGLVEMVDPNQNGLLVPPGSPAALASALLRVLDDDALREKFELGATQRSQTDLSWLRIAERTVEIYERALRRWGYDPGC